MALYCCSSSGLVSSLFLAPYHRFSWPRIVAFCGPVSSLFLAPYCRFSWPRIVTFSGRVSLLSGSVLSLFLARIIALYRRFFWPLLWLSGSALSLFLAPYCRFSWPRIVALHLVPYRRSVLSLSGSLFSFFLAPYYRFSWPRIVASPCWNIDVSRRFYAH